MPGNLLEMLAAGSEPLPIMSAADMDTRLGNTMQPQTIQPPKPRMSLLETIGRISDVIARVGGADALYQPSIDAREDRMQQIDLDAMRKTLLEQQIAGGADAATERGNAVLGSAVRGLQAIQARGGDISKAWPILARQAGIPDDRAMALGNVFAQNPDTISAIASMAGEGREFGLQPFYAQGPDGQLRAYQIGKDGTVQPIQLGEGEVPIDPLKFVDTGGQQVGVGSRSGSVRRILPNTVKPDTIANIGSRERIAAAGNASRERVAATRGSSTGVNSKASARAAQLPAVLNAINTLEASIKPLEEGGWSGAVGGYVPSSLDAESDVFETNLGLVRQLIRGITKVEGEGSISDYETKLQQATLPSRTQTPEGRKQAIANLKQLVADLSADYRKGPAQQNAPRQSAPRRNVTPASRTAGKPTVSNW